MAMWSRLLSVFRAERVNREIEEEQQFHIACRTGELMEGGMEAGEADRRARLEFGSRTRARAESHDARLFAWLESTLQDVYYGFRSLKNAPGFAAIAIVTLALGIGANTAIFSAVSGVLINPLPYPHADRIVAIYDKIPNFNKASISYPNFLDWQKMNRTFSAIAACRSDGFNLLGNGEATHLQGEMISAGFFEILGVHPLRGRTFSRQDDRLGAGPVAMISESLWRRKFGSAPDIIGRRVNVDGIGRTIVGVVPSSLRLRIQNFQNNTPLNDFYIPVGQYDNAGFYADRGAGWGMGAIGLMKPGVTIEQAREDMDRVSRDLGVLYPDIDHSEKATLVPLKEEMVGDMRPVLLILLGAVCFVLLICCVNVANLLLARSTSRQRELAIRVAIGAGQMRIIRQLLTESILLALIGGGLGLLIAQFGTAAAIAALPQTLPRAEDIGLDFRVLLFTLTVSLGAGIAFGLAPALKTQRRNTGNALRKSGRTIAGTRSRTQRVFVVMEMAMALVLLVGAGLMIRTLFMLWAVNPGFDVNGVITFYVSPSASLAKESPAAIRAFFRQAHQQLASTPGIEDVSLSWGASPMEGDSDWYFWFAGRPKPAHMTDLPMALIYIVESDYQKTMQIPLRRGRFLTDTDDENSRHVAVIDETLAEKYFPGQDPIGKYLVLDTHAATRLKLPNAQIVGIAGHINQWGLDSDAAKPLHAQIYLAGWQISDDELRNMASEFQVYARGKGGRVPSFEMLRSRLHSLNGELAAFDSEPMQEIVRQSIGNERFTMWLLAVFAGLALTLASIGIYGVLSYMAGQRTQEIGVRMALGAARIDVLRIILSDGARMILAGTGIGIAAALALTRVMASVLFGVKPTDFVTFALVVITLALVGLLACYVPAWRAMKIDPMIALRQE